MQATRQGVLLSINGTAVGFTKHNIRFTCIRLTAWTGAPSTHNQIIQAIAVVFGKANNSAINLSVIADASNPTGGFVINGEAAYDYSGFSSYQCFTT
jgi:hypothetical protein